MLHDECSKKCEYGKDSQKDPRPLRVCQGFVRSGLKSKKNCYLISKALKYTFIMYNKQSLKK